MIGFMIVRTHLKLRFNVNAEKLSSFSRWKWKQPSGVKQRSFTAESIVQLFPNKFREGKEVRWGLWWPSSKPWGEEAVNMQGLEPVGTSVIHHLPPFLFPPFHTLPPPSTLTASSQTTLSSLPTVRLPCATFGMYVRAAYLQHLTCYFLPKL